MSGLEVVSGEDGARYVELDGRKLPSVTTIVGRVLRAPGLEDWRGRLGNVQADAVRDEAAEFGKSIHAALGLYVRGLPIPPVLMPDKWAAVFAAAREWVDENVEDVLLVEETSANRRFRYSGTPDLVAYLVGDRKSPTSVDWKTGDPWPSHALQSAAYLNLEAVRETGARRRLNVHISKTELGSVSTVRYTQPDADFAAFTNCLGLFRWLETHKGGTV